MERVTTGDDELDSILHGGLLPGGLVVLTGPPGAGKTVLAQQLAFANAAADRPAYYYSTLSESHTKLRRHLAGFSFYDDSAIGERVHLLQLSEFASNAQREGGGLGAVIDEIAVRAFHETPSVVIVDSSRALQAYGDRSEVRAVTFELASRISHTGAVLIYVGEYGDTDPDTAPEFAVADTIIELANEASTTGDRRTLRVAKFRGSPFIGGTHPFVIGSDGLAVDTRLEALPVQPLEVHDGRASFADPELDTMTGGGIPRGDVALSMGPSGVGKTSLALQFIAGGLRAGEACLYLTLEESRAELIARADTFGMGFSAAVEEGRLQVLHGLAGLTDLDTLAHRLRSAIERDQPRRIVVDAISSLTPDIERAGRVPGYLTALSGLLRRGGATAMLTFEVRAFGDGSGHDVSVSGIANNVVLLRYMERQGELGRVLSVLKMRRSAHDTGLLRYRIQDTGISVIGEADNVHHLTGWVVLSGEPGG